MALMKRPYDWVWTISDGNTIGPRFAGDSMKWLFFLVSVLLITVIACGSDSTPEEAPEIATVAPTQAPTATTAALPEPTTAAAALDSTPSNPETATPAPTLRPTRIPPTTAASQPGMVENATLVRLGPEPPTLDPHLAGDTYSSLYVVEVFGGLVTLEAQNPKNIVDQQIAIVPDLAKDWDISNGGKTYTFHLREDAKFHDGRPVTAEDFKWSIERVADPATEAILADTFLGDIVGFKDMQEGRATSVEGVRVIDDQTLSLTIDAPKAYFLAKLTYPAAFVLDRNNVEGNPQWFRKPNGTGPFRLSEYEPGETISLTRNEFYHLGPPNLEEVRFILSGGDALLMYENDEIHVTGVGLINLDAILDPSNPLSQDVIQAPPSFDVIYVGMNADEPPFDDPKVRQALNYAVDKETLTSLLLQGLVTPAKGILPPSFPGYNPDLRGYEYDPEKAMQLLRESKYGDNLDELPRIVMTMPGSFGAPVSPIMEAIIQSWRENLGIEIELLQTEWAIFLDDLKQKRFQMFGGMGWVADYPDPETFLDTQFHSESSNNHTKYSNPEVDRLLEAARIEMDEFARFEMYHEVEEMILEDAPWVPLWHGDSGYALLKPNVKDYYLFPLVIPRFRYAYITEE